MRLRLLLATLLILSSFLRAAENPPASKPTLVIVHGAWAGGWQSRKIVPLLEARGVRVFTPSLSGLGEHFHNGSPSIGLETHINDIVNLILFEDLRDVVLLGHSYGGMVVTGVADRVPERIRRVVYLDAFVPEDGESLASLRRPGGLALESMTRDGMVIPTWVRPNKGLPRDVPHPLKTFTDAISLKNPAARQLPATYILTVEAGKKPEEDDFFPASERAKAKGWPVLQLEANHVPQWYVPEATAEMIAAQVR